MIRNRHFMSGLGIGLIIGALLLQVMLIGQRPTGQLQTKEQIEEAAASINLKVVDNDQELLTEEEWEAKKAGNPDIGDQTAKPTDPLAPDAPDTPDSPESADSVQSPVNPTEPETSDQPDRAELPEAASPSSPNESDNVVVEYKIAYGSTLSGVADGLLKAGVISDKDAFLKQAKAKKINYKVRTGTFTFEIGEDYDSIISKISPGTAK